MNKIIELLVGFKVSKISIIKTNNEYYKDSEDTDKIVKHHFFRKRLYIDYIVYDVNAKWEVVDKLYLDDIKLTDFNKTVLVEVLTHIKDNIPFVVVI